MTVIICGLRKSGFVRSAGAAASPAGNVILTAIGTIPLAVIVTPTIVIASLTIIMVILTIVFAAPTIIIVLFTIVIVALTIVIVTPTIVIATMTIVRMAALVLKTLKIAIFALFPAGGGQKETAARSACGRIGSSQRLDATAAFHWGERGCPHPQQLRQT